MAEGLVEKIQSEHRGQEVTSRAHPDWGTKTMMQRYHGNASSTTFPQRSRLVQVMEEMRRERQDELLSRADGLAFQMASLHYQKAERRARILETSKAVVTLQGLLMEELREKKILKRADMAKIIGSHCLVSGAATPFAPLRFSREPRTQRHPPLLPQALKEAEEQIQKERSEELGGPAERQAAHSEGEERLLEVQQECRMTAIVQEALSKRDEVVALLTGR